MLQTRLPIACSPVESQLDGVRARVGRLDLDWLGGGLAVGGAIPAGGAARLSREHAVTHVVDVRAEERDDRRALGRAGISFLWLPTPDRSAVAPEMIRDGVAWIGRALAREHRVLVHCQHGIGRSALLALCVLVERGADPLGALLLVKNTREIVSPSPEQLEAFIAFSRSIQVARAPGWPVPSLDELMRVAYRHLAAATAAPPAAGGVARRG